MVKVTKHRCLFADNHLHIYYSAYCNGCIGTGRTPLEAVDNLTLQIIEIKLHHAEAFEKAIHEVMAGRSVVILFPLRLQSFMWPHTSLSNGMFIRFSNVYSSLKSLRVDTLIVVQSNECDPYGLALAKEMTRIAMEPKIIQLEGDNDNQTSSC